MSAKKRICFIYPKAYSLFSGKYYDKGFYGGAGFQLYLLAKEFAKKKQYDTDFIVADYGQNPVENYNNIRVIRSINFQENKLTGLFKLLKALNKSNADIYVHRSLDIASGFIATYCFLRRKKFVYMVAADSETDNSNEIYNGFISKMLANLTFRLASKVFTQNIAQSTNLKQLKNCENSLLNNSDEIIEQITVSKKRIILWAGKTEKLKRPEIVFHLAEKFPQVLFKMILVTTPGREEYFEEIKKKSENYKNIEFFDFIPAHEIDKFFKEAYIHINTSTKEGFPNTFIHAAKYKTPIVSLCVNPNNFLNESNCGFDCNNSVPEMESNISLLLNDLSVWEEKSKNAFNYALKNHDLKKNFDIFYNAMETLTNRV